MKHIISILLLGLCSCNPDPLFKNGLYKGFEKMCWADKEGNIQCYDPTENWYHLNTLYIEDDSVFLYKAPVVIEGKDTIFSASDGAFYYYLGSITQTDSGLIMCLTMSKCDYCMRASRIDSITGFIYPVIKTDTYKVTKIGNGLSFNKTDYIKTQDGSADFMNKGEFYFDSNQIYRVNPKGQYNLISTGFKYYLKTKPHKLDKDTLRICIERFSENLLIEKLNPNLFNNDTQGIHFKYYTLKEIKDLTTNQNTPITYIEIGTIIEGIKTARISLTYKINLPESIHNFSERQHTRLLEFNKVGNEYILDDLLSSNSWELVERN